MCKILILQSHDTKKAAGLVRSAWDYFARTGETDGFGAAWIGRDGKLGWVKSSSPDLGGAVPDWGSGFHQSGGSLRSGGGWLLIHGRKATCGVNLPNTHPMLDGSRAALIHNGVVRSDVYKNQTTSCDSELLLRAWDEAGAKGLSQVSGYFAFGLLIHRRDGWHAVVARDGSAKLRCGRLPSGTWAWSTTDDGLRLAGATPICDHRANLAACFGPDGKAELVEFTKAVEMDRSDDLAERWAVASGRASRTKNYGDLFA